MGEHTVVPIELMGFLAIVPAEYRAMFTVQEKKHEFNAGTKRYEMKTKAVPLWRELGERHVTVPFGIILFLIKYSDEYKFKITKLHGSIPFKALDLTQENIVLLGLREYQDRVLGICARVRGGLIESPTGSGKSQMMIGLALLCAVQHNVAFVAPSVVAKENFVERFAIIEEKLGHPIPGYELVDYEEVRAGRDIGDHGHIVYSGGKAILNDYEAGRIPLRSVGSLLTDEAHHWESDTWQLMLLALPNLVRSLGFSGTMFEGKVTPNLSLLQKGDANIIAGSGPLLISIKPEEIGEYIDLPDIHNIRFVWDQSKVVHTNSWRTIETVFRKYAKRREFIASIIDALSSIDRITVVPVAHKKYGLDIMALCSSEKVACWFGGGEFHDSRGCKQRDIEDVKELVASGRYNTLIVTSHVDESLDIPDINTTFLTEGKKARKMKQRVGRAIRKSEVKSAVVNLWDVDGQVLENQAKYRSGELAKYYKTKKVRFDDVDQLKDYIANL